MSVSPTAEISANKPVTVFRTFSIASFITIAIAGVFLAVCFRYISIKSITLQSEASNLVVAQAVQQDAHEDIASFLVRLEKKPSEPFPPSIATSFFDLVKDTAVRKVKVYSRNGDVIFSTKATEVGRQQPENDGFIDAMNGKVTSELIYRDSFNFLDGVSEEDNLVQTYLPVRVEHTGQAVGVFEIYTDVAETVELSKQTQIIIALTSILTMVLLYLSLLAIVRRIERVIVVQQDALKNRSDLLAVLSTRMLDTQENERQRVAEELHERVAQSISAVKLGVEGAIRDVRKGTNPIPMLEAMVPSLQAATQDVRLIALGLCPPSLHELGLIPTLRWRCREFMESHPDINVEIDLKVSEEYIPDALRTIIYRVVDDACSTLSGNDAIDRILLSLDSDDQRIILSIGDDAREDELDAEDDRQPSYLGARDRTLLSGGKFSVQHNTWGGKTMQAVWFR